MKKLIFLVALTLAAGSTNLSGMNREQEIAEIKDAIEMLSTLANDSAAGMTADNGRYAAIVRNIEGLTQNLVAQHEEIKILRNTIQQLTDRVTQLEQPQAIKPESAARKILAHPLTWFGLIGICVLASIVYERQQKKEDHGEAISDDDTAENSNIAMVDTDPVQ
jgi:hypothetical protein